MTIAIVMASEEISCVDCILGVTAGWEGDETKELPE